MDVALYLEALGHLPDVGPLVADEAIATLSSLRGSPPIDAYLERLPEKIVPYFIAGIFGFESLSPKTPTDILFRWQVEGALELYECADENFGDWSSCQTLEEDLYLDWAEKIWSDARTLAAAAGTKSILPNFEVARRGAQNISHPRSRAWSEYAIAHNMIGWIASDQNIWPLFRARHCPAPTLVPQTHLPEGCQLVRYDCSFGVVQHEEVGPQCPSR